MKAFTPCCGIDVSQLTLDVCYQNNLGEFFDIQVSNNNIGFQKLLAHAGANAHFVMEVTGVYYIKLAFFLHRHGCKISVVNGVVIKRFIQMHLERNKTDKKDARWICRYAISQQPELWQMPDNAYFESKQIYNTIRSFTEQIKMLGNQKYSISLLPVQSRESIKALEKMITGFKMEIVKLEKKLLEVLKIWQPEQVKNISSVMSIGKRATAMLIVATQGFKNTTSHRQLVSFAGLAPVQKKSGTSINGRPSISRQGGKELRDVLYMCAMNAKKNNIACKALYERLIAKGKSGKLALIAVCNKLLRQVFAVVKNNTNYQPNYCSPKP